MSIFITLPWSSGSHALRVAQHSVPLKDSPRYLALSPVAGVVALCYHGAVIQLNAIGMA
jgi:hypothetical protein